MTSPSIPLCEFCQQNPGSLLCDAVIPAESADPKKSHTCDRRICRNCAGAPLTQMHINRGGRVRNCWDTRDICPECRAAGRKTGFES